MIICLYNLILFNACHIMIQLFEDAINNYSLPLAEETYNAFNFTDYLKEERFHHGDKGCDCKMIRKLNITSSSQNASVVNKICQTHQVTCSKTGWELGWYRGKNKKYKDVISTKLPDTKTFSFNCVICGQEFFANQVNCRYCKKCHKEALKAKIRIHLYRPLTVPLKID